MGPVLRTACFAAHAKITRIISARAATQAERKRYANEISGQ
jgi:uncharacterized DUF497 family protein